MTVRRLAFLFALAVALHYTALGTGDIGFGDVGGGWRRALMAFFGSTLGVAEDWQLRLVWGAPAVALACVVMLWASWPRRK